MFLSSQFAEREHQQDSGLGFGGPGLWTRAPMSISQDIIKMHIQNTRPVGHTIPIVGAR